MKRTSGGFTDDEKMPLFSLPEGEAAIAYLEIEVNLAEARKHTFREDPIQIVKSGYDTLSIRDAEKRAGEYLTTFLREVDKETERLHPDMDKHVRTEIARRRARDILACNRSTDYTVSF